MSTARMKKRANKKRWEKVVMPSWSEFVASTGLTFKELMMCKPYPYDDELKPAPSPEQQEDR